jgi:hypothetical protein
MGEAGSRGAAGILSLLLLCRCAIDAEDWGALTPLDPALSLGRSQQALLVQSSMLWPDANFSVCWEDLRQSTAEHRGWAQAAIEAAFETVSPVDFNGWQQCGAGGAEVVIHVGEDVLAARAQIGARSPSAQPSVWLNFREQSCGAACRAPHVGYTGRAWPSVWQGAIEVDAVHEFAHVLGFGHEMDRSDTPAGCAPTNLSGFERMLPFGYWDLTSVNNYCNPALDNDARLSPLDVAGLQAFYGEQERALVWLAIGNVRDYGAASVDLINFAISGRSMRPGLFPVAGDFDGDGAADLFWYDPAAGSATLWWSRGDGRFEPPVLQQAGAGGQPLAGDFNGDGRADVFFYNPTGDDVIWWGGVFDHSFRRMTRELFGAGVAPLVGDFDGDRCSDLFGYNPSGGGRIAWSTCNGSFSFTNQRAAAALRPFAGDFDADGDDDLFAYDPSGTDSILKSNGGFRSFTDLGQVYNVQGNYTPAVGDFDGDGIDDIVWNGVAGAPDELWLMRTPLGSTGTAMVTNTAVPQSTNVFRPAPVGDFNRDGLTDILWYDED